MTTTLETRFVRRVAKAMEQSHEMGKSLGKFIHELLEEAALDNPGGESIATGQMALDLTKHMCPFGELPFAWRVLHNAMFNAWIHSDDSELESKLVQTLLSYPSFTGLSPVVAQWEEAVNVAMEKCFEAKKLQRMHAQATADSNKVLFDRSWTRLLELERMEIKPYLAGCLAALGTNPNTLLLVGDQIVAYAKRMGELAQWSIERFGLCTVGIILGPEVHIEKRDTISVTGSTRHGNVTEIAQMVFANMQTRWDKTKKQGDHCNVRLILDRIVYDRSFN